MKNTAHRCALLLACVLATGCRSADEQAWIAAQRYLEPELGILAGDNSYEIKLGALFSKGYESDVVFRMVCIPSFEHEWLVGIRKSGETFRAFVLRPDTHVWATKSMTLEECGQIRVTETSADLDAPTAQLLADLWSGMLLSARHPPRPIIGCDGVGYHFSMYIPGHGPASGKTWSPAPDSRTGLLAALGRSLAEYVDVPPERKDEVLADIRRTAERLRRKR